MALTNKIGPKTNPYAMVSKQAEGVLTENSFVMAGTTQDEVKPITTGGNVKIVGYVDRAYVDNDMVSVLTSGNVIDAIAQGTIADGDILVTGDGVGKVKTSSGAEAPRNKVGRALHGAAEGERIELILEIETEK